MGSDNNSFAARLRLWMLYSIAFTINLEEVLEVLFSVQTSMKPYRIFSLVLLMLMVSHAGLRAFRPRKEDRLLILLFGWGATVAAIRFLFDSVSMDNLFNNIILIGINFLLYLALTNWGLKKNHVIRLIVFYNFGIVCNLLLLLTDRSLNPSYGEYLMRGAGFFTNPNSLAFSCLFAILGLIFILFSKTSKSLRVLTLLFMATNIYLVNISGSRGGLYTLGLFVVFFILWVLRFRTGWAVLLIIPVLAGTIYYVAVNGITVYALERERLKEERSEENVRGALALAGFDAFLQTNLVGLGMGQFQYIDNFYPLVVQHDAGIAKERLDKNEGLVTHSTYIQLLADYGLVGFFSFCLFWYFKLKQILDKFWRFDSLILFKAGMALVILVYSLGHVVLMTPHFWFFLSFIRPHVNITILKQ